MITTVEEMIECYVNAWNKKGLENYKAAFSECWAEDAAYTDPNFELVKGVDGIAELAQDSLEKLPERSFSIVVTPDYHHHVGRYTWKINLHGKSREGYDYFEFNDGYKITRLISFFKAL